MPGHSPGTTSCLRSPKSIDPPRVPLYLADMKKNKRSKNRNMFEVVVPFPGKESEAADDGLFDDCPICQELRKQKEAGQIEMFDGELGVELEDRN